MGRSPTNSKEKLLQAAIDLIWRNGYANVSVDHICDKAGVQKGSFYHYFPSKLDLTLTALDEFYENSKPFFDEIFHSSIAPQDRFIKLAEGAHQMQKDTKNKYGRVCGCPFISLGSEMAAQEEAIYKKTNNIFKKHEEYYRIAIEDMKALGQIPEDTDSKAKAKQIYSYIAGCLMMARVQNNLGSFKKNLKAGIFNILNVTNKKLQNA